MIGEKFGRLLVLEAAGHHVTKGGQRFSLWKCRCDCGVIKPAVLGPKLRSGNTKSCGCLRLERLNANRRVLPSGRSLRNSVYHTYELRAGKNNLAWELTDAKFDELTQKDCHYCGCPPANVASRMFLNGDFVYNGIDRMDNLRGYTIDNTVSCCGTCNKMKRDLSVKEFLSRVRSIAKRHEADEDLN
jgi:hypothetical protein